MANQSPTTPHPALLAPCLHSILQQKSRDGDNISCGHALKPMINKQNHPFNQRVVPSLLSSQSSVQNYRGFLNLAALILFFSNFRLVLENLVKYGILINAEGLAAYLKFDLLIWVMPIFVFMGLALMLERAVMNGHMGDNRYMMLVMAMLLVMIMIPIVVILKHPPSPASGILLLSISCICWLKLYSYVFANRQFRLDWREGKDGLEMVEGVNDENLVRYPNNLTWNHLLYFLAAPTLCYQLNYPRSNRIRRTWLSATILQLVFLFCLMIFMIEQWYLPVVKNSYRYMEQVDVIGIVERVLKLSIPSVYIWLVAFYTIFHLWLNIIAEILHFGDREFYLDWWNATTMSYYWRSWNIPTHNWLVRHVYLPCRRHGLNEGMSRAIVFLFSAIFHELLISVPLHTFKLYFFVGMLMQIPATYLGKRLKGKLAGNLIFWISFCFLGQPIGVLLYHFDVVSSGIGVMT